MTNLNEIHGFFSKLAQVRVGVRVRVRVRVRGGIRVRWPERRPD